MLIFYFLLIIHSEYTRRDQVDQLNPNSKRIRIKLLKTRYRRRIFGISFYLYFSMARNLQEWNGKELAFSVTVTVFAIFFFGWPTTMHPWSRLMLLMLSNRRSLDPMQMSWQARVSTPCPLISSMSTCHSRMQNHRQWKEKSGSESSTKDFITVSMP